MSSIDTTQDKVEQDKPLFNMADNYLKRVDHILEQISYYLIHDNHKKLFNSLVALFHEVSPYISRAKQNEFEQTFSNAVIHFQKNKEYILKSEKVSRGMVFKNEREDLELKALHEWKKFTRILNDVNLALKSVVHSTGLLMPNKESTIFFSGDE